MAKKKDDEVKIIEVPEKEPFFMPEKKPEFTPKYTRDVRQFTKMAYLKIKGLPDVTKSALEKFTDDEVDTACMAIFGEKKTRADILKVIEGK